MARALGSYPGCRWFKSDCRYHFSGPLVKRLRHRPFTAESWVRFPYGSPIMYLANAYYGVCEFFFCSISALATYLPLIFENCHLHCHLRFCKRLFFISKRKCISNRFAVSRLSFLKHMTVDITRCSYAGMSHIT